MHTFSTRRQFLKASTTLSAGTAAAVLTPRPVLAHLGRRPDVPPPLDDPALKVLVQRALDAAKSAGATYTDVRLTHRFVRSTDINMDGDGASTGDTEQLAIGVRALVNGYWGFASGMTWNAEEAVRLGDAAARLARTGAAGKPRRATLAPMPVVREGHWETPVGIDPFTVDRAELIDHMVGLWQFIAPWLHKQARPVGFSTKYGFERVEMVFGNSEGSLWTQRTTLTSGGFPLVVRDSTGGRQALCYAIDNVLTLAGLGWERFDFARLQEVALRGVFEMREDLALPLKPVDVGKYQVVLDASSLAEILSASIGAATQLDRLS